MRLEVVMAAMAMLVLASEPAAPQTVIVDPDADQALPHGETTDAGSDFSFGGGTQDFVVPASLCQAWSNAARWIRGTEEFFGNEIAVAGSASCPVTLPHGARVTGIECIVRDSSAAGDVRVQLVQSGFDVVAGAALPPVTLATVSSTGVIHYQVLSSTLATPVTLRRRVGNERNIYWLFVSLPADVVGNAGIRDCAILWNRQVGPAPAAATFSDVPVGHPQRQFVEALFAAGITGGCSPTTYCPDSPLTRGQMAVFLSVALGLHFPN